MPHYIAPWRGTFPLPTERGRDAPPARNNKEPFDLRPALRRSLRLLEPILLALPHCLRPQDYVATPVLSPGSCRFLAPIRSRALATTLLAFRILCRYCSGCSLSPDITRRRIAFYRHQETMRALCDSWASDLPPCMPSRLFYRVAAFNSISGKGDSGRSHRTRAPFHPSCSHIHLFGDDGYRRPGTCITFSPQDFSKNPDGNTIAFVLELEQPSQGAVLRIRTDTMQPQRNASPSHHHGMLRAPESSHG
ncbi:hypothetical protein EJ04DRAFT_583511 [Polyplosphaeria fusca]|uniref:Uncharacterized protein n=1 Tax=Polyplosphaeria fusca TaxID=682080 RepID=A0A9P4R5C2_9PLEO|nr:hypothetical protein EJ04DRAFT_583511 [Polyplosphaeria fusca]